MLVQRAEQVLRQAREPIHLPAPEVPARVQQLPEEPEAPPDPALGLLASGGDEVGVIKIWNLGTGELATRLWGHRDIPFSLCCVSSTTLASSSADRTIKVWDLELGTCTSSLESYYAIRSVCSLTARTLVSAEDGAIKIWDLVTGRFQHLQAPAFIESDDGCHRWHVRNTHLGHHSRTMPQYARRSLCKQYLRSIIYATIRGRQLRHKLFH